MRARALDPLPPMTSDSLFQVEHTCTNTPSHTNNDFPRVSVYLPLCLRATPTTHKRRWKHVDIDACVFFYVCLRIFLCLVLQFVSACFVCLILHCPMCLLPSSSLLHETYIQIICAFRSGRSPSPTDSVRSFTSTGSRANGPPSQVRSVRLHCTPRPLCACASLKLEDSWILIHGWGSANDHLRDFRYFQPPLLFKRSFTGR